MEGRRLKDEWKGEEGRMNGNKKMEGLMEGRRWKDEWKGEDGRMNIREEM